MRVWREGDGEIGLVWFVLQRDGSEGRYLDVGVAGRKRRQAVAEGLKRAGVSLVTTCRVLRAWTARTVRSS